MVFVIFERIAKGNMKKIILTTIWLLSIVLITILGTYVYTVFGFAKGELEDSQRIFNDKKNYILNLSFDGKVQRKVDELLYDHSHRYTVKINLYMINPKPSFYERQYYSFYEFINDSTFSMTVSQSFFNHVEVNENIHKDIQDYYVRVKGAKLQLLSKNTEKWLP
jgi:hypothetical protein